MTYPYRGTYRMSPRARTQREIVFFAASQAAAFQNLVRVTREESYGEGVPGFVDALTCQEAHERGVPFHGLEG